MKKYWWVNQGRTFKLAIDENCIWAPYTNKSNKTNFHWETMDAVQLDDIVFSYYKGEILSYNVVKKTSYRSERPFQDQSPNAPWKNIGRKIDLIYNLLEKPIKIKPIITKLRPFLSQKYSPYDIKHEKANQGYLFEIMPQVAEIFFNEINNNSDENVDENIAVSENKNIDDNSEGGDKDAKSKVRIGHDKFRKKVKDYWNDRCCITNFKNILLTASHIKPWRHSNKKEKVDPNNGLLLSPSYNAAFDKNLISFNDDGSIIISNKISGSELAKIGVNENVKIMNLNDGHKQYLKFHRDNLDL